MSVTRNSLVCLKIIRNDQQTFYVVTGNNGKNENRYNNSTLESTDLIH